MCAWRKGVGEAEQVLLLSLRLSWLSSERHKNECYETKYERISGYGPRDTVFQSKQQNIASLTSILENASSTFPEITTPWQTAWEDQVLPGLSQ